MSQVFRAKVSEDPASPTVQGWSRKQDVKAELGAGAEYLSWVLELGGGVEYLSWVLELSTRVGCWS